MKYAIKTKQGYVQRITTEGIEYTFEICKAYRFEAGEAGDVAMALAVEGVEAFPLAVER